MDKKDLRNKITDILLQPFPHKEGLRLTEKTAFWFAGQIISELKETDKEKIIEEIEKWMVGRLPAFLPKNKAKEIFKIKLFSAEDIKAFLNKL